MKKLAFFTQIPQISGFYSQNLNQNDDYRRQNFEKNHQKLIKQWGQNFILILWNVYLHLFDYFRSL